jgi:hypothetical protein
MISWHKGAVITVSTTVAMAKPVMWGVWMVEPIHPPGERAERTVAATK